MFRTVCLLFLVIKGCGGDETISGQSSGTDIWELSSFRGHDVTVPITITFPQKGQIAGRAPCNRYSAKQGAPLPWFEVETILSTKMACPELDLETAYFKALKSATLAEIQGDIFILSTENATLLTYRNSR